MPSNSKLRDPAGSVTPAPKSGNQGDASKRVFHHITVGGDAPLELPHLAQASLKACEVSLESTCLRKQMLGGTSEGQAVFPVLPLRRKG